MKMVASFHQKKNVKQKVSFSFGKCLKDYASTSTVHGVSYILDEKTPVIERLLWLIVVSIFGCVAVYMVVQTFTTWQENKVITTLKTVAKPVSDLDFPAITICSSGQHFNTVEKVLTDKFNSWKKTKNNKLSLKENFALYLEEVFKMNDTKLNIMDILSTAMLPQGSGENAVRKNEVTCTKNNADSRRKRAVGNCLLSTSLMALGSLAYCPQRWGHIKFRPASRNMVRQRSSESHNPISLWFA